MQFRVSLFPYEANHIFKNTFLYFFQWNQLHINLQHPYEYNEISCFLMSENREKFEGTFIDL